MDQYYDREYARICERISNTRNNAQRFYRINTSNKFNINIAVDDSNDK